MRGLSAPSSAKSSSSTSESSPPASPSISSGILDMFSASACTRPIPQTWAVLCSRREVGTHSRLSHRCLPCPSVVRPSPPGVSPSPSPSPSGTSVRYTALGRLDEKCRSHGRLRPLARPSRRSTSPSSLRTPTSHSVVRPSQRLKACYLSVSKSAALRTLGVGNRCSPTRPAARGYADPHRRRHRHGHPLSSQIAEILNPPSLLSLRRCAGG